MKNIPSVSLIGGGPGAWDLITVRGMRRLAEAEVILTDHLGPAAELEQLCDTTDKEIIDVSKLPYGKQVAQEKINELLVLKAREGKKVARLKGGDPFVFGRGFEELQHLHSHGITCEVIPGITSAIAVPALADVPITQRGVTHSFTVISGHIPPNHPDSLVNWKALAGIGGTIAVIMGVKNAPLIVAELIANGMPETTPVCVIQEGSMDGQRSYYCQLGQLPEIMAAYQIQPPAVYVIGEVAALHLTVTSAVKTG